jgi:hypothetical protein
MFFHASAKPAFAFTLTLRANLFAFAGDAKIFALAGVFGLSNLLLLALEVANLAAAAIASTMLAAFAKRGCRTRK